MRCPNCNAEAADGAAICPSCGKGLGAAPASEVAAPGASTAAPAAPAAEAMTPAAKQGWRTTALTIAIAVVLGVIAGYLARKFIGPAQDPMCAQLCQFSEIPAVANNPTWQRQVADANCRCETWPHTPPPAQNVHPVVPNLPEPPPAVPAPSPAPAH